MTKQLTFKQALWVKSYVRDFNALRATREVYNYPTEGANQSMSGKLVKNDNVMREADKVRNSILDDKQLLVEDALRNLKATADYLAEKFKREKKLTNDDIRSVDKVNRTLLEVGGALGRGAQVAIAVNTEEANIIDYSKLLEDMNDKKSNVLCSRCKKEIVNKPPPK